MKRVLIVLFLASAASLPVRAEDWPMLAHDVMRTGATAEAIRPPIRRTWVRYFHHEGLMPSVQPVVAAGRVYFGTLSGTFHCVDAATGKDVWKAGVGWPVFHTACLAAGGTVVFGTGDGTVRALRAADGKPAWAHRTGAPLWNAPLPYGGRVYVGGRDGVLTCLDAATGRAAWTFDVRAPICQSPAVDPKRRVVYFTSEDMVVHALNAADGREKWRSKQLHGTTARSFHPVIAPDGTVMTTAIPYYSWSRARRPLEQAQRRLFGTVKLDKPDTRYPGEYVRLPNWRFSRELNARMERHARDVFLRPDYHARLVEALTRAVKADPATQCLFLLDPETGRQKFVLPVLYTAFAKSAFTPPLVMRDGRVITKWSALLPSTFHSYQRFVNLAYVDTATGKLSPVFDEGRLGSGHGLGLIGDESCQLTAAGGRLLNLCNHHGELLRHCRPDARRHDATGLLYSTITHWYGVGVIHRVLRGQTSDIAPGQEDMTRGFGVGNSGEHATGNHTAANMPVVAAGGRLFWMSAGKLMALEPADKPARALKKEQIADFGIAPLTDAEVRRVCESWPVNWDDVEVKPPGGWGNHKVHTPDRIRFPKGTRQAPDEAAALKADDVPDAALDRCIWEAAAPGDPPDTPAARGLRKKLAAAVAELISQPRWMPYRFMGGKHPSDYLELYVDPAETVEALARALPLLPPDLQAATKAYVESQWRQRDPIAVNGAYAVGQGAAREAYRVPPDRGRVFRLVRRRGVERAYAAWLWGRRSGRWDLVRPLWGALKGPGRHRADQLARDAGNNRCASLIAVCRLARRFGDDEALAAALPAARKALRARLAYALKYHRGNVANDQPALGLWRSYTRWTYLTPEVARLVREHAGEAAVGLVATYVDRLRPYWYLNWGPLSPASRENSMQLPHNTFVAFAAKAWVQQARPARLAVYCDIPACKADVYAIQKLAITLTAMSGPTWQDVRQAKPRAPASPAARAAVSLPG